MGILLNREAIFAAPDIQTEDVLIPQWGGTVRVKNLTASERDAFEESTTTQRGNNLELNRKNFRAKLVALCVVDEDGKRIFDDKDIHKLGAKSAAAMDLLFAAASRLSGISKDDEEELLKNSEGDQTEDSSSAEHWRWA